MLVPRGLGASHDQDLLTQLSEPQFEEIAELAAHVCEVPLSGINVVDDAGHCRPTARTRINVSQDAFCQAALNLTGEEVLIVPDASKNARFSGHELVTGPAAIRFYAGARIILLPEGKTVGVLWVADRSPHEATVWQTTLLETLARQVATQLALRRANSNLVQREDELRSIIEANGEATYGVDLQGRCTFINAAGLRLLGYPSPESLLGRPMHELIHYAHADGSPYPREECTILAVLQAGGTIRLEEEVLWRADGTPIWVIYTSSPLYREGQLLGAVITFVDVTEQRRTREELTIAARVRERFAGVLGHDLRNPLATVLMGAQLIAHSGESETTRTVATRVVHAAERMERLIRDLLDFIRVREGGSVGLALQTANLAEIARDIVGEHEVANPGRRIEIEISGDVTGQWDPDRVAQICSNLVANAIEHGAPNEPVHVKVGSTSEWAVLTVENSGPPIPDALLPHLFDPFRRGESSADAGHAGLGLGLFIVRQMAVAHGGDVSVQSDARSTAFTVRLPRGKHASSDAIGERRPHA